MIENVGVKEVVTAKATEDQNLIIVDRNAAATLSHRKLIYPNSDSNPISLCTLAHRVESLNRIEILFGFAWDAGKNVNKLIADRAGWVVMSAMIQAGQVEPNVHVDIVLLDWLVCVPFLDTGACHDEEFIPQAGDRVTMAR